MQGCCLNLTAGNREVGRNKERNELFLLFTIAIVLFRRRQWHPTPVLLPGKSHRQRSLVGCSPWGREESDTTEWLHFHFSLSCIGDGNGNPLQYSCLEYPRDGEAWWAAVYGVAQSRTRLKRLTSSSNTTYMGLRINWCNLYKSICNLRHSMNLLSVFLLAHPDFWKPPDQSCITELFVMIKMFCITNTHMLVSATCSS